MCCTFVSSKQRWLVRIWICLGGGLGGSISAFSPHGHSHVHSSALPAATAAAAAAAAAASEHPQRQQQQQQQQQELQVAAAGLADAGHADAGHASSTSTSTRTRPSHLRESTRFSSLVPPPKSVASSPTSTRRKRSSVQGGKQHTSAEDRWIGWYEHRLQAVPIGSLGAREIRTMFPILTVLAQRRRCLESAEKTTRFFRRFRQEVAAGNPHAQLSTKLCNVVIKSYAATQHEDYFEKALQLVLCMHKQSRRSGGGGSHPEYENCDPNATSVTPLIVEQSQNPEKAESVLHLLTSRLLVIKPHLFHCNAILSAWAKSSKLDKAARAEEWMQHFSSTDVTPNVQSYQLLMTAWSTSPVWGAAQRCEEILAELVEKQQQLAAAAAAAAVTLSANHNSSSTTTTNTTTTTWVNTHCFTAAITAWGKSREPLKARSAYRLLQTMQRLATEEGMDTRPNVVTYTAVLNACAFPPPSATNLAEYFQIAFLTFQELSWSSWSSEELKPNHRTYATMLKVCQRTLLAQERFANGAPKKRQEASDKFVGKLWDQCCAQGQVSFEVLQAFHQVASRELFEAKVHRHGTSRKNGHVVPKDSLVKEELSRLWHQLPLSWSCKVVVQKNHDSHQQTQPVPNHEYHNMTENERQARQEELQRMAFVKSRRGGGGRYSGETTC